MLLRLRDDTPRSVQTVGGGVKQEENHMWLLTASDCGLSDGISMLPGLRSEV